MKKIITIAAAMLFAATTMWAEPTWSVDFSGNAKNWTPAAKEGVENTYEDTQVVEAYGTLTRTFAVGTKTDVFGTAAYMKFSGAAVTLTITLPAGKTFKAGDKLQLTGKGGKSGKPACLYVADGVLKTPLIPDKNTDEAASTAAFDSGEMTLPNDFTASQSIVIRIAGSSETGPDGTTTCGGGLYLQKVIYTENADPSGKVALSGEWSAADYNLNEDASAKLPTFTVNGGEAVLGTDYSVAYSVVADESNIVTLDAANGITAINTAAEATATVRATVTLLNTEDYTLAATEYNCEISVVKPTCAAPVITFKGYDYEQGKYEFSATCATEDVKLSYRLKGEEDYLPYTAGESFFVVGTGDSNDKVIVKATKSGYNEKATTTAYYLNAAPAATSPEALIPFLLGNDDSFKNHAYKYKSVTIGEENAASSIGGTAGANTLKLRTNQNDNTLTLYVNAGYKVTNVTITGKTNSTDATKVVKVAALAIDGEEKEAWTGKDVVFPISSAEAIACSTGAIYAASTIKFTFAAGGTGSMHTQLIASIVVTYENGPATAIENIENANKAVKFIENGQLIIIRDGVKYNAQGLIVK